ncbi:uncharacterized protein LOC128299115 [Anopheles moucheti]|uniref:uncharacterized protein LOC128299115 n=1 Tax=Anopheles moucheti TaxID=186751 RepID=UPI0022F01B1F|nr:uncharacterized protein LOC128299115 [Anopheles moucheti]
MRRPSTASDQTPTATVRAKHEILAKSSHVVDVFWPFLAEFNIQVQGQPDFWQGFSLHYDHHHHHHHQQQRYTIIVEIRTPKRIPPVARQTHRQARLDRSREFQEKIQT